MSQTIPNLTEPQSLPGSQSPVKIAWAFAIAIGTIGALGFLPNPVVGDAGIFTTNLAHDLVHLGTAAAIAFAAIRGALASARLMIGLSVAYALIGAFGFLALGGNPEGHLLGVLHINALDNFLHLGLSGLFAAAGIAMEDSLA